MYNPIVKEDMKFIINNDIPWNNLEGKTILISGANGFLASYIVKTILYLNENFFESNAKIIGLVRNKNKALEKFPKKNDALTLQVQDLCQPLKTNFDTDFIIHAASQASPKYYNQDPVGTLCPNIVGTYQLLELARKNDLENFLFFSSGEVYGETKHFPTSENDYGYVNPTEIRSCYAESKRMGENMCVSWFKQYGVPTKIIRPFHTYGPGMSLDDGRVFADFVSDIINRQNIVMKSHGKAKRAFCYLADAIAGFFTVLFKGQKGESYNVGNDKGEISISDLANKLVNLYPEYKLKVIREIRKDSDYLESKISRNSPDISKIRSLGWEPYYSIDEGFKRTVESFNFTKIH
ncbi:NAD-dependent epimerase/dehydratase family protein [uncultured Methanobacterium sp.]|uniref:NAD-dependent epimerase/dehydratase family protein n=1 Tax=uncultured Methanobacterium sp. TaxID=176306 RepID=UPI002AA80A0C|nr:NAD-dependent epimerase/dehydratase family protein [uncultured Methanobacterium sp.]